MVSWSPDYSELSKTLPRELHDEHLYRSDVKKLLLELISGHPSPMLEDVKISQIPSIEKIENAIASAGFPREDPLFMAKFTRQLMSYIRDIGYEMVQEKPSMTDWIQNIIDYCESLIKKYIKLVQLEPKDPRITNLKEWKAYKNDPYNLDIIRSLYRAVSRTGLDPTSVEWYVRHSIIMQRLYAGSTSTLTSSFQQMMIDLGFFWDSFEVC